jgi:hypothetical protein
MRVEANALADEWKRAARPTKHLHLEHGQPKGHRSQRKARGRLRRAWDGWRGSLIIDLSRVFRVSMAVRSAFVTIAGAKIV